MINANLGAVQTRTGIRFEFTGDAEALAAIGEFITDFAATAPNGTVSEAQVLGQFGHDQIQLRKEKSDAP